MSEGGPGEKTALFPNGRATEAVLESAPDAGTVVRCRFPILPA